METTGNETIKGKYCQEKQSVITVSATDSDLHARPFLPRHRRCNSRIMRSLMTHTNKRRGRVGPDAIRILTALRTCSNGF